MALIQIFFQSNELQNLTCYPARNSNGVYDILINLKKSSALHLHYKTFEIDTNDIPKLNSSFLVFSVFAITSSFIFMLLVFAAHSNYLVEAQTENNEFKTKTEFFSSQETSPGNLERPTDSSMTYEQQATSQIL